MTAISRVLRGPQKGTSQLGGSVKVLVYSVDQFQNQLVDFPKRSTLIATGYTGLPAINGDGAILIFDMDAQGHGKAAGTTTVTQFGFRHELSGKVAGYDTEKYEAIDEYLGKDLLVVKQSPNGRRTLYGSLFKPMRMELTLDLGAAGMQYVGLDIKFVMQDVVDFPPVIFDSTAVLAQNTVPEFPNITNITGS